MKWIDVKEKLPPLGQGWVLVTRSLGFGKVIVDVAVYENLPFEERQWKRLRCPENGKPFEFYPCDVTHWQPYPAPAKQKSETRRRSNNDHTT